MLDAAKRVSEFGSVSHCVFLETVFKVMGW